MEERAPGARRGTQVCQDLQGRPGCLAQPAQLGQKVKTAQLENQVPRETLDHGDSQDLQVRLAQLEKKVLQGSREMWELKANWAPKESLGPKEKQEPQVYGALWGHKAPLDPKGRKVMLVHVEPLEVWV